MKIIDLRKVAPPVHDDLFVVLFLFVLLLLLLFVLFVCCWVFLLVFLGGWVWVGLLLGFFLGGLLGFLFFGGGGGCWSVWGELQLLGLRLLENILYFIGHVI